MNGTQDDSGFSLIELLIVILILGIVTTIVVLSVAGITDEADDAACLADRRLLEKAGEAYFAQTPAETIPATGDPTTFPDAYEQTLVDAEFLRQTSKYYDLDTDGQLVQVAGSPCTV